MTGPVDRVAGPGGGLRYRWPGPTPPAFDAPSVTTIVNATSSSGGLVPWATKLVAVAATSDLDRLRADLERDRDATIRALAGSADRVRDEAASLGSRAHNAIASGADPAEVADDLRPYVVAWRAWLERSGARVVLTERTIWAPTFAGTLDAVVELDGRLVMLDHKTGRTLMPGKVRLQLAGYASGDFVGEAGVVDREATDILHRLDGAAVVHIRPELDDGLRVYPLAIDDEARAAWRAAVELYAFFRAARLVPSDEPKEDPAMDEQQVRAIVADALEELVARLRAGGVGRPSAIAQPAPRSIAPAVGEGDRHAPDHNPLKRNKRGLYCPTKLDDDSWCPWTAAA